MILLEGTRVLVIQFKNTLEDLFQQSQENIIVFNRSKEIVFINSNASKELHLSNTKLNHLQLTTKSENEWTQFINTIEQNMTSSCCVSIINDGNQKINLKIWGYLIKNKQLIFGRVLLNFPGNIIHSYKEIANEVGKGTKFIIDFELRKHLIENQNRHEFYEEKISEMTLM